MSSTSRRRPNLSAAALALLLAACSSGPASPSVPAPPTDIAAPTATLAPSPSIVVWPSAARPMPSPTEVDTPAPTTTAAPTEDATASPVASATLSPSSSVDTTGLSASYQHVGEEGQQDQVIALENDDPRAAEVVLELVPLDAAGQPVDDVSIQTLLGSDRDGILVLPEGQNDFLAFSGPGVARVRDVLIEFKSVRRVAGSFVGVTDVELPYQLLGPQGSDQAAKPSNVRRVRFTSRSPVPVVISFAYQVFDKARGPNGAQNALALVNLVDRLSLPAGATVTADITDEGVAAVKRWADTDRNSLLVMYLPPGQPFLTYVGE